MSHQLGYLDLDDENYVYKALLDHGMFSNKLPSCFSSEGLAEYSTQAEEGNKHSYISYFSTRNMNVSRQFAIPHPESYSILCQKIKDNWEAINTHIGQPEKKFNFCHVRKFENKKHIFEMNYQGREKWAKEEIEQDYYLGCSCVVETDISNFFPSIYSHSIPWAIQEKQSAKKNQKTTRQNGKAHWSNDIDQAIRGCKDGETNGLLIGPHASQIVSEIILTKIDACLQKEKFKKIIRHIDDYIYFAKDEVDAIKFIKCLELKLKEYELLLHQKKTKIIPLAQYFSDNWPRRLARFSFPDKSIIGFSSISSYLNFAISIVKETGDYAAVNYAIKVIAKKKLSNRAKKLYIKKVLSLALLYPYILPLLEKYVFFFLLDIRDYILPFLRPLFDRSVERGSTDALAFCFYYATKYQLKINLDNEWSETVISLHDCISILLAWRYAKQIQDTIALGNFEEEFERIKKAASREQDKFWLFLYEHAKDESNIPKEQKFLKKLKKKNISFLKF